VQATKIVDALDVSEQVSPRLVAGGVDTMMDAFGFEGVEEALHGRFVPAVAFSAHGRGNAGSGQCRSIGFGCVLDSSILMMDQPRREALTFDCHVEGVQGDS
jgi:hypothetical protein